MKCNTCPAHEVYDYDTRICELIPYDQIRNFKDGSCGCHRKSVEKIRNDLKKQEDAFIKTVISFEREQQIMYELNLRRSLGMFENEG